MDYILQKEGYKQAAAVFVLSQSRDDALGFGWEAHSCTNSTPKRFDFHHLFLTTVNCNLLFNVHAWVILRWCDNIRGYKKALEGKKR
jgi:hypothetical protein